MLAYLGKIAGFKYFFKMTFAVKLECIFFHVCGCPVPDLVILYA